MNISEKRKAALAALENHARRYKVTIPDRLKKFYAGDFDKLHSFQLALTPPTWLNKDDDAVNGPGGDWSGAKNHVPLFITDQSLYVVANLKNPEVPIGWYMEEECMEDGPQKCWASLDAFLAAVTTKKPSGSVMEPAYPSKRTTGRRTSPTTVRARSMPFAMTTATTTTDYFFSANSG